MSALSSTLEFRTGSENKCNCAEIFFFGIQATIVQAIEQNWRNKVSLARRNADRNIGTSCANRGHLFHHAQLLSWVGWRANMKSNIARIVMTQCSKMIPQAFDKSIGKGILDNHARCVAA
jgi:hypothetical protein